ncbi:MAG: DNA gyrase inhibitor YacG [Myxococcales bacterium]|nr:DNA gyrase inhibitor YacG [Myxococcales bacterium]
MARQCPTCQAPSATDKVAPFCSDRCQLIDLGKWLGEEYRVTSYEPVPEELLPRTVDANS